MNDPYNLPAPGPATMVSRWRAWLEDPVRGRRRLIAVALVIAVILALRRCRYPAAVLCWAFAFLLAIAPVLLVVLVFECIRRGVRRYRS